ncbi:MULTISPECIES: bifunctional metallophosphatase/5'-nucleotidase [Aquimarina]|uniref:Bifunctional metallophosphatase/5'-nucleotidase n=1 Tax=Aquimarina algiphila TaxID=2047982 RepID=A0A554VHN6_9FLAO|nr:MULTISPECIES: metallophosphatase [Aquimarina]TSE07009.1 bifunctional metallophosphatase/5'-nucleotidase [Aquimarina algiphila]
MQNRRRFIQQMASATAFASLGGLSLASCSQPISKKITVLHSNDVHSQIDPLPNNHSRYPGLGGFARRASVIEQVRKQNPNTILLDAGDIFQGTPYFNYYGGEIEFKLMSKLDYDLATIGNHDFDNGIDGFLSQLPNATFDFVSANYDFTNTVLNDLVKPYKVLIRDGIRIGVFGLGVELEGLVNKNLYKETGYLDPIEIAQDMSRILKEEEHCDLIICLSHIGYDYKRNPNRVSDLHLAKKTKDIDLIIGGHTHTLLPEPTIVDNALGEKVLVNQCGMGGVYIGQIDFYFDSTGGKTFEGKSIEV